MSALKRYTNHGQENLNDGHSSFSLPSSFDSDPTQAGHACVPLLGRVHRPPQVELGIADVQRIFWPNVH